MKLVTIKTATGGVPGCVLSSGELLDLRAAAQPGTAETLIPATMRGLLCAGEEGLDLARRVADRIEAVSADEAESRRAQGQILPVDTPRLAPVPDPTTILSVGQAYHSHVAEMKGKPPAEPHGFLKSPSAVTGTGADIVIPRDHPDNLDFEGEFCAIIGRECHGVSEQEAMSCVAGYTVTNDVSARDWVHMIGKATTTPEARTAWDLNHMGKQFPGFAPFGPALVTRDEIADPMNLTLETRVNGAVMQSVNTSDLIFTIAQVIAYFSRWYRLLPGDVISTGTPGGVGFARDPKVMLGHGDIVEVEVSGVGILRNRFVRAAVT